MFCLMLCFSLRGRDGARALDRDGSRRQQTSARSILLLVLQLRSHSTIVDLHRWYNSQFSNVVDSI